MGSVDCPTGVPEAFQQHQQPEDSSASTLRREALPVQSMWHQIHTIHPSEAASPHAQLERATSLLPVVSPWLPPSLFSQAPPSLGMLHHQSTARKSWAEVRCWDTWAIRCQRRGWSSHREIVRDRSPSCSGQVAGAGWPTQTQPLQSFLSWPVENLGTDAMARASQRCAVRWGRKSIRRKNI